jgi:membrane protease subunit (stomatin/prohibitin family)
VALSDFISKQFIKVIQWNEDGDNVLSYRYPMQDMEIENGGQLTVRESQLALFVNEGRIADVFAPGLHTLNTRNLPVLTDLMNWSKDFESPFKSDVYFFPRGCRSTRSGVRRSRSRPATRSMASFACAPSGITPIASLIPANSSLK